MLGTDLADCYGRVYLELPLTERPSDWLRVKARIDDAAGVLAVRHAQED